MEGRLHNGHQLPFDASIPHGHRADRTAGDQRRGLQHVTVHFRWPGSFIRRPDVGSRHCAAKNEASRRQ